MPDIDSNELRALQASLRGVMASARGLDALSPRVDALDASAGIDADLLADLARVSAAHATSAAALRGFVETMQRRREGS